MIPILLLKVCDWCAVLQHYQLYFGMSRWNELSFCKRGVCPAWLQSETRKEVSSYPGYPSCSLMKRRTGCHLNVSSVIQHPAFVAGVARHFPSTACLCIPLLDSWFREVYSLPSLSKAFCFHVQRPWYKFCSFSTPWFGCHCLSLPWHTQDALAITLAERPFKLFPAVFCCAAVSVMNTSLIIQ